MGFVREMGAGATGDGGQQIFTQAGLRIVVREGDADLAGPVVRRFGLSVDDAQRAMRRAMALGAETVSGAENTIIGLHDSVISFD